jgi:mannose-6-phosphate isomerase-like protein (cupin superfamily)
MKLLALLGLAFSAAWAADPSAVTIWSAAELKGLEKKLAPKINEQKVATEILGRYPNSLSMIAHREGDGEAELHETMADFFVVENGEATLVTGGEVSGAHTTQPHEIRGPSIKGGERRKISMGDIVHIPAGVPHQLLIAKGSLFTYFVVKVEK